MNNKQEIPAFISKLLHYARLAPSVHNTQPWRFSVTGSTVSLVPEPSRFLKDGDPTERELWISLGVCFETLLQAAQGLGLAAALVSMQTDTLTKPIASIMFTPTSNQTPMILELLQNRHSYRGKMRTTHLSISLIQACRQSVTDLPSVSVQLLEDRPSINRVADFTYQGMRLALSNPAFRKELAGLINYNWSPTHIGMHGFVLNRGLLGSVWEKWSISYGFAIKQKAQADKNKILEASGLIFVATTGDVPSFWLNAGRAYMRIAMEVTKSGLAHSTIAAPVEAASFHEDIEKILQTTNRIQAMIRVGKAIATTTRTSPRLDVEELLLT